MIDLHNHTIYSDGIHDPEIIILNAIENGIEVIGISDHHKAFFMDKPKHKSFEEYVEWLNLLKEKYTHLIEVKVGIEINLNFDEEIGESRIPYEKLRELDFVLLERVEGLATFQWPNKYHVKLKEVGRLIEKIDCEVGLAHTDLLQLARIYGKEKGFDYGLDYVIGIMKKYNLYWELNTHSEHGYFDYIIDNWNTTEVIKLFKKLNEANIKITASTDTHNIDEDFSLIKLKLANRIASRELVPGRDGLPC